MSLTSTFSFSLATKRACLFSPPTYDGVQTLCTQVNFISLKIFCRVFLHQSMLGWALEVLLALYYTITLSV